MATLTPSTQSKLLSARAFELQRTEFKHSATNGLSTLSTLEEQERQRQSGLALVLQFTLERRALASRPAGHSPQTRANGGWRSTRQMTLSLPRAPQPPQASLRWECHASEPMEQKRASHTP